MINRLLYVSCDDCGVPAGTADHMTETTKGARLMAASFDFVRVRVDGKLRDRCPKCAERAATMTRGASRSPACSTCSAARAARPTTTET